MASKNTSKIRLPKRSISKKEFRDLAQQATEAVQQQRAATQILAETLQSGRAAFDDMSIEARERRLNATRDSALAFGKTYLPHFFEQPSAPFHSALDQVVSGNFTDADLEEWKEEYGVEVHRGDPDLNLLAVQIFRGGGKSVLVNLCDHLRRLCHGLDPYIIIAGDTFAQAGAQLEDIKDELASNEKIRADFGALKPDAGIWKSVELFQRPDGRVTWREGQIISTNGVRVDAIGRGGKMRGRRHGPQRPTCFTGDDLDNDENVVTKEQRDKAWNWVTSAVIPAMDPNRGVMRIIGTTIHFDCVIARAVRKTDDEGQRLFTSISFPAMHRDETGKLVSNWPARFPTEKLNKIRGLLGPNKFGAEYMNDPRDPETQLFNPNGFTFYTPLELQGKDLRRILYCDPSKGKKGKGRKKSDFSSFVDNLYDGLNRVSYINDAQRKRLTPTAARAHVIDWYLEARRGPYPVELWVEENSFGDIMAEGWQDELRRRGVDISVNTLLHTTEKNARIERHSVRVHTGGVRYPEKWAREDSRPEWFSEYEDFPAGSFDDTIDGIESADHIATEISAGRPDFRATGVKQGSALLSGF
jgi:predicted phage terminase large subunit-like protein